MSGASAKPQRADVFCRVVDNFGDAGVCWRLSQRLRSLGMTCRLVCDRTDVLAKLVPAVARGKARQTVEGIEILDWDIFAGRSASEMHPGDLVLETFGCRLPEAYEDAMASANPPPFWVNLDYLSAEDWVESCHNVWGMHPTLPLRKLWFFPGFTDRTGGLLIEDDLNARRVAHRRDGGREALLASIGADPDLASIFIFCYPVNDLNAIAGMLLRSARPRNVLLAQGEAGDRLEALLKDAPHLHVRRPPFVAQRDFDALLWSVDAAVVRGEDSFVRAQLAGLPFLWAVYPTDDLAHHVKLDAWLRRRNAPQAQEHANALWVKGANPREVDAALDRWLRASDEGELLKNADEWAQSLLSRGDLVRRLLERAAQSA